MAYPPVGGIVNIRVIDHDEHPLVVIFEADGSAKVSHPGMCPASAAVILRRLASVMEHQHGMSRCSESAQPEMQQERPTEPLGLPGELDEARKIWTDGRGHTWDLSATWADMAGQVWRWTGRLDSNGAPWMRSGDDVDEQPLDVVRAVYGPIAPVTEARD
jgi:hypothetical protein